MHQIQARHIVELWITSTAMMSMWAERRHAIACQQCVDMRFARTGSHDVAHASLTGMHGRHSSTYSLMRSV